MSRARKCDRCGSLYEFYQGTKITEDSNAFLLIDRDMNNKYWSRETYDLCPVCMDSFLQFLHIGGDNNDKVN